MLYILYNKTNNLTYNGYTVDFNRRLKQHNCQFSCSQFIKQ
jgi:predicted GIY-YIG superfamily endonuclease